MSVHYYSPAPAGSHRLREVPLTLGGRTFKFLTDRGVFATRGVDRGTRLLLAAVLVQEEDIILDLGCGYGVIGLVAAARATRGTVHLVDINARAVELARENAARHGLTNVIVHQGDGVEPVRDTAFDLVLTNPPIRAGRGVVLRFFAGAHTVLRPGGRFYFVARTGQGARTLAQHAGALFGNVREAGKGGGFRVYCARKRSAAARDV